MAEAPYGALNYSHGLSKGPSFGTGRGVSFLRFSQNLVSVFHFQEYIQYQKLIAYGPYIYAF